MITMKQKLLFLLLNYLILLLSYNEILQNEKKYYPFFIVPFSLFILL